MPADADDFLHVSRYLLPIPSEITGTVRHIVELLVVQMAVYEESLKLCRSHGLIGRPSAWQKFEEEGVWRFSGCD